LYGCQHWIHPARQNIQQEYRHIPPAKWLTKAYFLSIAAFDTFLWVMARQ
jgi:hypothetical protein